MRNTMTTALLRIIGAAVFLAGPVPAAPALYAGEEPKVLRLEEFIAASVKNSPEVFYELEKIRIADAGARKARGVYDVVFSAYYNHRYDEPFTEYSAVKIDRQTDDVAGISLERRFPRTGTRLKAGLEYTRSELDVTMPGMAPSNVSYYSPLRVIELQQPLLKNWLGIVDAFPLKQAKLDALITSVTVDEGIETVLVDLYTLYFDWYLEYAKYRGYVRNVRNAEILLERTRARFTSGLGLRTEYLQAERQYLSFLKSRDESRAKYDNLTRKIVSRCYGAGSVVPAGITPEETPGLPDTDSPAASVADSRQMKALNLTKELLESQLKKERNERLPDLNLSLNYRRSAYDENPGFPLAGMEYDRYSVGLALTYPIGINTARGALASTEAKLEQWNSDVERFERDYRQSYDELNRMKELARTLLKHDDRLLENASNGLREREGRYMRGQDDIYYVIEDRNTLLKQEITRLETYVQSQMLTVQLLALTDGLKKP